MARLVELLVLVDGDQWAAAFLASEPEYDKPAWIDAMRWRSAAASPR